MDIDMLSQLPRAADHALLTVDRLKILFPHLSEEQLETLIPTCETYRDKPYSSARDSDGIENHTHQQNAHGTEYR